MKVVELEYRGYRVRLAVFGDVVTGFDAKAQLIPKDAKTNFGIPLFLERPLPREDDAEASIRTLAEDFIDETLLKGREEEDE